MPPGKSMPLPGEEFAKMRPYAYSKILEHKLILSPDFKLPNYNRHDGGVVKS